MRNNDYTRLARKPVLPRNGFDSDIERGIEKDTLLGNKDSQSASLRLEQPSLLAIYDARSSSPNPTIDIHHGISSITYETGSAPSNSTNRRQSWESNESGFNSLDATMNTSWERSSTGKRDVGKKSRNVWTGWQKGVAISCMCSIIVLIFNIALYIWASTKPLSDTGTYMLAEASHEDMNTINTWTHLGINILSTIILAGSNYSLQVLLAPTRESIDCAHSKNRFALLWKGKLD